MSLSAAANSSGAALSKLAYWESIPITQSIVLASGDKIIRK